MRAVAFTRYGSPDNLRLVDVPKPVPGHDEVLIAVRASSINSWDWEYLNGIPFINRLMFGLLRPKPGKQILGADIAGTIEAVGERVTRFSPGDEVFGDRSANWGGFAEYACARETDVERKPANATFKEAATVPQAGVLALQAIRKAPNLQPGDKVLVSGAGGGVGSFAVQLAKQSGCEVTGVDAAHKLTAVRSFGADHVIDYQQQDYTRTGIAYDLIVDCQITRSLADIRRALAPAGTLAIVGGRLATAFWLALVGFVGARFGSSQNICLVAEGPNKGLQDLRDLIEAGKLKCHIDSTYRLADVPQAMRHFGAGRHTGKIAITIAD